MTEPRRDDSDRITALSLLATFRRQLLPGVLRRVAAWKGIPPRLLAQLAEDVVQDLSVDCLEHAGELVRLDRRSRNARWMQRAERALYRLRRYEQRCRPLVDEPFEVAEQHDAPDIGLPTLVSLDNGRANVAESARRQGLARRALRMQLDEAATRLGWNNERRAFWQARAAEALTGLAADQLRLHAGLFTVDPGPPPDLERRRARLHRLARRFPVQPSTLAVRSALQPWRRRRGCPEPPPRALLQRAVELAPDRAAGWLWLFEA
ncbi:MAG: hypothetical protein KAI24_07455, partial [Planctomycetes bacterium]|nr:hypothetical protein [Planctomycetota bacterium]